MGHKQNFMEIFNFVHIDVFTYLLESTMHNTCAQMELMEFEACMAAVEQGGQLIASEVGWNITID